MSSYAQVSLNKKGSCKCVYAQVSRRQQVFLSLSIHQDIIRKTQAGGSQGDDIMAAAPGVLPLLLLLLLLVLCPLSNHAFVPMHPQGKRTVSRMLLPSLHAAVAEMPPPPPQSSSLSPAILQARMDHLATLFPMENVTSMAWRAPELLQLEQGDLAQRVAQREAQLEGLLPSSRPLRMMSKVPALVLQDFDSQIKLVADNLAREFPRMDLHRVIYQNPMLLSRDWESFLHPKIRALRTMFPKQDLGKMITRRPDLLSRDVEGKMKEKIKSLTTLLPSVNIQELVARQPELLARNISLVSARIDHLATLFPTASAAERAVMISRKPSLLLANAEQVLGPKLDHLKRLLGSAAAQELCQAMPTIFNRDLDKVEVRLASLISHLPGIDVVRFLKLNPAFLTDPAGDVGGHLMALQAALPPGIELPKLLAQEPQLYTEDAEILALKLQEVQRTTGLDSTGLAERLTRDARFLGVPYGLLAARLRFLTAWQLVQQQKEDAESGEPPQAADNYQTKALQRINLSSLACMPLERFIALYPAYPHFLASKLGGSWTASTEGKNGLRLEKVYSGVVWRETGRVGKVDVGQHRGAGGRRGGGQQPGRLQPRSPRVGHRDYASAPVAVAVA